MIDFEPSEEQQLIIETVRGFAESEIRAHARETDETGKRVVRPEDWDSAEERVQSRRQSAEDRFDAGLSREKTREKDLDDLFRRASEKLSEDDDEAD